MSSPYDRIKALRMDAIVWKAEKLKDDAGSNPHQKAKAIEAICATMALVKSEFVRDKYVAQVSKMYGEKIKFFNTAIGAILNANAGPGSDTDSEEIDYKFPAFFSKEHREEIYKNGFTMTHKAGDRKATGIHFAMGGNKIDTVSNFTIEPLYHVWSQNILENKKLFVVKNAYEEAVLDFETGSTISVERFSATVNAKHNFMWKGNIQQLKLLMELIGYSVPRCEEVKILGWQPEGFFAYTDKFVSNGEIVELNDYGIGKHNDRMYFSPSRSVLYKNAREDDNVYETMSFLNFQTSTVTFERWADLMNRAYPENGKYAIAYSFIAMFRDVVLRVDGNCPHLYVWGSPGSGKSKMMESIASLFFHPKRSYALNSGTDFALSRFLQVFRNCFHFLNELDDSTVKPIWLQWIKGAYDNEGRERGKGGSKNMTEVMKVNSAIGLAGQRIINTDDNALPMRCIIRGFKSLENMTIPKDQMAAYNELKALEDGGGFNSLLIDLLQHREFFAKSYGATFADIFVKVRKEIDQRNYRWNERIGRNYCYLLAMAKLANEKFRLPFTYDGLYKEVIEQINEITIMITGTDATSEFWRIVSMLADQGKISRGLHYDIRVHQGPISLYKKDFTLLEPTRLLYVRLETIHSYYRLHYRSDSGREGMNVKSLLSYLENREYYIGSNKTQRFTGKLPGTNEIKSMTTSCHIFDYDKMEKAGYFMDYITESSHHTPTIEQNAVQEQPQQKDLPF
jgi:hypothetical protein